MTTETWRPVVGWEGLYEVSDHGRVRSIARIIHDSVGRSKPVPARVLKPGLANGYPVVHLARTGTVQTSYVHRLVMRAFVGDPPIGCEVAHNDGDPANPSLTNLRYATSSENHADKHRHGTQPLGVQHVGHRLCDSDVRVIVEQIEAGRPVQAIARDFGVSYGCIRGIREGRSWRWLTGRERSVA